MLFYVGGDGEMTPLSLLHGFLFFFKQGRQYIFLG